MIGGGNDHIISNIAKSTTFVTEKITIQGIKTSYPSIIFNLS